MRYIVVVFAAGQSVVIDVFNSVDEARSKMMEVAGKLSSDDQGVLLGDDVFIVNGGTSMVVVFKARLADIVYPTIVGTGGDGMLYVRDYGEALFGVR